MLFSKDGLSKDYKNRCGNCHEEFDDKSDAYCRYCGTKRGEGDFLPYENFNGCVYGPPPVERVHICGECGFSWTTERMVDLSAYCPKCGGKLKE